MTLPTGQISFNDVNTELQRPSTQALELNDTDVRSLAGVGGAGTTISMSNLQNKTWRIAVPLTISTTVSNYDIYSNRGPTYVPGRSDITLAITPTGVVTSTSQAAALSLPNQFSPTDTVTILNQGTVIGRGGNGGAGGTVPAPTKNGQTGGLAFSTTRPVTIQNAGTFAGGGGGGGGGNDGPILIPRPSKQGGPYTRGQGGGGGGGGAGIQNGTGGAGSIIPGPAGVTAPIPGTPGQNGTPTAGGAGGASGGAPATPGGNGGGRGQNGLAAPAGGSGGQSGLYAAGFPLITWTVTGTRQGRTGG